MDGIRFADGFDTPDRLAFGLGAPQLITVAGGCLLAFAVAHLPLPGVLTIPFAAILVLTAAGLGWIRVGGRPALDWALFAAGHLIQPRQGVLLVTRGGGGGGHAPAVAGGPVPSNIVPLPCGGGRGVRSSLPPGGGNPGRGGARRVVFFSLKGGTGRTMLSTEVAAWLAGGCHGSTVLVDCDLRSASIGGRLGMAGAGILDYAVASPRSRRVDDYLAMHRSGLRVLLGPPQPANPAWPVTPAVLREVLRELDLGTAETVVIDVAPDLNDLTRAVLRAADDVIVVIVPTATGIVDAYRTTAQLRRLGLRDRLGFIVNRTREATDVSVAMRDLGGEVMAEILEDSLLIDAENTHVPAVLQGTSAATIELRRLAARVGTVARAVAR